MVHIPTCTRNSFITSHLKRDFENLCEKAKPYEEKHFKVRDGQFWRWQKRHGIRQSVIHGKKRLANQEAALKFSA